MKLLPRLSDEDELDRPIATPELPEPVDLLTKPLPKRWAQLSWRADARLTRLVLS